MQPGGPVLFPPTIRLKAIKGNYTPIYLQLSLNDHTYDLTGATVYFTVKRYITDSDPAALIQVVTPLSLVLSGAADGLIKIPLTAAQTSVFPDWYQDFICDIQLIDNQGNPIEVATGTISSYPGVTKTNA
jgi:hypothetical protein